MDSKEDEEISIDFSKVKSKISGIFKSDKNEEKKADATSTEEAEKEEEEIAIDFSRIKNLFKSDKEDKHEHFSQKEDRKENEEISIDFGRIKNFFKPGKKEHTETDEEISVDWRKIAHFFKKYGIVFIVLIPIILSIYIRMQSLSLPFTDRWAADTVINSIKSQVRAEIDKNNPNLPEATKNSIVERELQTLISKNNGQIGQQIKATSDYFKSFFQDENGKKYMSDIDPYYWSRYAKNIIDHGHPGDVLKDGKPFDNHQLAPLGRLVYSDMFHAYFIAYFHKFLHFFMPDLELTRSMFYNTVFFSALCVLLVFLIARRISGNVGGFFAALMMAVNGAFLSRTITPDNDVWVVFFPLIVTWLFVVTIDIRNALKIVIISAAAGFFTGLFTTAWGGWWYIFDFLLATIAVTFLYLILISFNEIRKNAKIFFSNIALRNIVLIGIVYFFSTAVFVASFSGLPAFRNSFIGPLSFPSIKAPVASDLWPNVLTTVAELNEGSVNQIINSIGGKFLFFISLIGLILAVSRKEGLKKFDFAYIIASIFFYAAYFLLIKLGIDIGVFGLLIWIMLPILVMVSVSVYKNDSSYDFKLPILLSLWVISTIFASIKGIRFTVLLAPAFSVAFGVALGKAYLFLSGLLSKEFRIHKAIGGSILIVIFLLVYVNPIRGAISAGGNDIPIINDAWYTALTAIKQNSSENAIITSWWDFGHHFKSIADRRVTFDGTTQMYPPAHWVGELFMTGNELEAAGILRMLDCGSNSAFNTLYGINKDIHSSLKILNEVILLSKKEAEKKLKELKFNEEQTQKILSFTHCEPPKAYVIASEDMIGKSGVWSHFGSWNFERADIWQNARKLLQEAAVEYIMKKFNYTKESAENAYFEMQAIENEPDANERDKKANAWVAPWPGYAGTMNCGKNDEGIFVCPQLRVGTDNAGRDILATFQINMSNYDVLGKVGGTILRANPVAFTAEDGIFKKQFDGNTFGLGFTVIPTSKDNVLVVMSSPQLAGSIFTRMFYMNGHGLRYFKLFSHQRGLTGADIYTYNVDWTGKNATIVDGYSDYFKKSSEEDNKLETEFTLNNTELNKNNTNVTAS